MGAGAFREVFVDGEIEVRFTLQPKDGTPHTHDRDELYFVASGRGFYRCDDKVTPVSAGDLCFAAAGTVHDFEKFTQDFAIWINLLWRREAKLIGNEGSMGLICECKINSTAHEALTGLQTTTSLACGLKAGAPSREALPPPPRGDRHAVDLIPPPGSGDHSRDRRSAVTRPSARHVSSRLKLRRDLSQRALAPVDRIAGELLSESDRLGRHLSNPAPAAALARLALLSLARRLKLGDKRSFLELTDGAEHLADERGCRRLVEKGVWAICGNERDAKTLKETETGLLHDQIAGEPARRLDDNGPHAVVGNALEHGGEARPPIDRVRAFHAVVGELRNNFVTRALGVARHRVPLAFQRVLVLPDVRH
jgi:hypothetical protein